MQKRVGRAFSVCVMLDDQDRSVWELPWRSVFLLKSYFSWRRPLSASSLGPQGRGCLMEPLPTLGLFLGPQIVSSLCLSPSKLPLLQRGCPLAPRKGTLPPMGRSFLVLKRGREAAKGKSINNRGSRSGSCCPGQVGSLLALKFFQNFLRSSSSRASQTWLAAKCFLMSDLLPFSSWLHTSPTHQWPEAMTKTVDLGGREGRSLCNWAPGGPVSSSPPHQSSPSNLPTLLSLRSGRLKPRDVTWTLPVTLGN